MQLNFTYYRDSDGIIKNTISRLNFRRKLIEVANRHNIQGFTLTKCLGAWQGKVEPSFQMSLVDVKAEVVLDFAKDLRQTWAQDSVMVTKDNGEVNFV